jgi:hypothetical protein
MTLVATRSNKLSAVLAYENLPQYGACRKTVTVTTQTGMDIGAALQHSLIAGTGTVTPGVNTGNGVFGAVTVATSAQVGTYTLKITSAATNAGAFEVIDTKGEVAGIGNVGAPYSTGGLSFTLADGSSDFVAGDSFTILVAGTEKYVWIANADVATLNADVAMLVDHYKDPISLTPGDYQLAVLIRGAAGVVGAALQYKDVVTSANQAIVLAAFAAKNIQSRTPV